MVRIVFPVVKHKATVRLGGKMKQKTFSATINPFNKDPNTGVPRTRSQIVELLRQEAEEWKRSLIEQ